MTDRGGYGSVVKSLLDGPDFQKLSSNARMILVFLKIGAGPSGIWVEYPASLTLRLVEQTGLPFNVVNKNIDELQDDGWLQRQRNVVWIVGHLRYNPHSRPSNQHHRQAIQKHVAGLPRLPIVRRFVDFYPEYFGDAPDHVVASLPDGNATLADDPTQALSLFEAAGPARTTGKSSGDNGIGKMDDSLSNSLSDRTAALAYEIGQFCRDNGWEWRLKTSIDDWAHQIRHEPKYAGVDHAYEVRRCNEWHQNNTTKRKAPDQCIRNWLERAVKDAASRFQQRGHAQSPRAEDYGHLD